MDGWRTLRDELTDALKKVVDLPADSRSELKGDVEALRRLVISQREPRIALVGKTNVRLHEVMEALGSATGWEDVREQLGHGRWYEHETSQGLLMLADLRGDGEPCLKALQYERPDVVLAVARSEDEDVDQIAGALIEAMERTDDVWGAYSAGVVAVFRDEAGRNAGDFKTMQAFKDAFASRGLSRDWADVVSTARPGKLPLTLLQQMPAETRFALARMSDDVATKRELAFELIRLASSLNAAIATVPIPVASVLPITSVQIAMVSGIAYLSGRHVNLRSLGEFGAAIGLNVGAGVAFRELARALIQWIPVAGPVISASIAAGATLTLGKAATRYYLG